MGMFDLIEVDPAVLPDTDSTYFRYGQTKSLECLLDRYKITADGRLLIRYNDAQSDPPSPTWITVQHHGDILFQLSNYDALGIKKYPHKDTKDNGVELTYRHYTASFDAGILQKIIRDRETEESWENV